MRAVFLCLFSSFYADSFEGKLYHYQDYQNKEFDAVIELDDGRWSAFEIKLGANQIDKAAENLLEIKEQIENDGGNPPSVLCVICGLSNAAYVRNDGAFCCTDYSIKGLRETASEYSWISEVIEDFAILTQSRELINCFISPASELLGYK